MFVHLQVEREPTRHLVRQTQVSVTPVVMAVNSPFSGGEEWGIPTQLPAPGNMSAFSFSSLDPHRSPIAIRISPTQWGPNVRLQNVGSFVGD